MSAAARAIAAATAGEGPKPLSLAPMRARKARPRVRSCVSGPTNGTVAGKDWTSGVGSGRLAIAGPFLDLASDGLVSGAGAAAQRMLF